MKIKLALRERKFIDAYIKNSGNATEAYLAVNPKAKRENASVYGMRMLEKVSISIIEIADKMGLTDPVLIQKLIDGLSATKESGTGFRNKKITDYNVIVKYLDMALKLKGKYPSEKHDIKFKGELKVTDARQKFIDKVNRIVTRTREDKTTK